MKKRTKQCFTAVTIAAMVGGSIGAGVPAMAAKVTLPRQKVREDCEEEQDKLYSKGHQKG